MMAIEAKPTEITSKEISTELFSVSALMLRKLFLFLNLLVAYYSHSILRLNLSAATG